MTAWDTSLLFARCCCGGQLTVNGETETSAIWFPFKWKYWQSLVRVSAPSPASVQKPTGNCLEEFRSPAVASSLATPPAAIQRHGEETLPAVWVLSALKDCDLEDVRGNGHIQSQTPPTFSFVFARKNGDLSSALEWLGDERSLKPELGNISGVQCSESVVSK